MIHENAPSDDIAPAPIDPGDSVARPAGGADPAGSAVRDTQGVRDLPGRLQRAVDVRVAVRE